MQKPAILRAIQDAGIVAIVRADSPALALQQARACIAGGVRALEVAFTTPGTPEVIKALREEFQDVFVGAGTVLDAETVRTAILAGAQFIISPNVNAEVIQACSRYQVPSMPGALTPTEVVAALAAGADIVKLFPADTFGPKYLKALKAPLPQAPLMPTGGVTLENMGEWIAAGAVALGIGSSLAGGSDMAAITARAQAFVARLAEVRGR